MDAKQGLLMTMWEAVMDRRLSRRTFEMMRLVYCHYDPDEGCTVGLDVLAQQLKVKVSTANRYLSQLRDLGYVTVSANRPEGPETIRIVPGLRKIFDAVRADIEKDLEEASSANRGCTAVQAPVADFN